MREKGMAKAEAGEVRVAIVGAGAMGREHARAFADNPGVTIAGFHSRTRARAEQLAAQFPGAAVYDSVAELHQSTRATLLVIAVPEMAIHAVSRECFRFPWTVLMEKPPGYNLADALTIREEARRQGRKVLVALNRRFYSATRMVLKELRPLPGPRHVHVRDQQDLEKARSLGHPAQVVENWRYANSIHLVDYLRVFGRGGIAKVENVMPWDAAEPDRVVAELKFESGDTGLYEAVWNQPGPWAVEVAAGGWRWEMRPLEQLRCQAPGQAAPVAVETHAWDRAFKAGFRLQAEQALAAARGRPSESPSLDDAIETMRLIAAIYGDRGAC